MAKVKTTAIKVRQNKTQIVGEIAEATGLTRGNVRDVMASLAVQARRHLRTGGCGEFMVPDLGVKLKRVIKPARKARRGVNPFTKVEMMFKAKPASKAVRAVAYKAAKDMAK